MPLTGALVEVTMEQSGRRFGAVTAPGGQLRLEIPEVGRATLRITLSGYRERSWQIRLESGRNSSSC